MAKTEKLKLAEMKKSVKAMAKSLGVNISLELDRSLTSYRRDGDRLLTCRELEALKDKKVPVWVVITQDDGRVDAGPHFVESANDPKFVMLVDGTCFAADFEMTEPDDKCIDEYTQIYGAVKKQRKVRK